MKRVVVIGGGPAGMMAAVSAKKHHPELDVTLIERNPSLGRKLSLTGGGRCNVTSNVEIEKIVEHIPKNGKFLYSALSHFNAQDIITFFTQNGCELKEEDHHRMFPKSNKSQSIIETLSAVLIKHQVKIKYDTMIHDVDIKKKQLITETHTIPFDYLVIATGGKTLPQTGSDGTGYLLAKSVGHQITDLYPAEVPLVSNEQVIQEKALQGLSFQDVALSVYVDDKKKKTIIHDLLFTHFGLSGPAALRASYEVLNALNKEKEVFVSIDFIKNFSKEDLEKMDLNALIENNQYPLPKRLISYLKTKYKDNEIMQILKAFKLKIHDVRGFSQAFVTNGGVTIKEIDPKTMKSKINESISFCGEIIDYNAYTGGYNITAALSSGYTAGKHLK